VPRLTEAAEFPGWIRADLAKRLELRERWRLYHSAAPETPELRPSALRAIDEMRRTTELFDQYDPGVTGLALECRHPFLDLRVAEFCLSLPPEPWCIGKAALREAAKGLLPDEIRLRPKTGMAGWAGARMLHQPEARWIDTFEAVPGLDRYVERRSIPPVWGAARPVAAWRDLRPLTLNHWLRTQQPSCMSLEEARHEIA
jgi:asparagine synthase (glutamine-hydrolysing)